MKRGSVRLYGHQLGYASFSQVTAGFIEALAETELFGGFVPIDYIDDEIVYPGAQCPVAINTGAPSAVVQALARGDHAERWLMLAPNSNRVPSRYMEWIPKTCTALLSPSTWGVGVLERLFPSLPVYLVQHGVHREYRPQLVRPALRDEIQDVYAKGTFRVLHMTSTMSERKGTKLLLDAVRGLNDVALTVVVRNEGAGELMTLKEERGLYNVLIVASDGMRRDIVRDVYASHHVVCQPSRAEGFGLVPLEARCCGVPVVATASTGHADHMNDAAGVVQIPSYADEPSDDMEGAQAPQIHTDDIRSALLDARDRWTSLKRAAVVQAPALAKRWTWKLRTGTALKRIVEERCG